MRDALVSVEADRTILFSLCDWGQADVNAWGNETGNSWRMSGDINRKLRPSSMPVSDLTDHSILVPHRRHRQRELLPDELR